MKLMNSFRFLRVIKPGDTFFMFRSLEGRFHYDIKAYTFLGLKKGNIVFSSNFAPSVIHRVSVDTFPGDWQVAFQEEKEARKILKITKEASLLRSLN